MIQFFMPMVPPTTTVQEHGVAVVNGKPKFYDTPELKAARQKYEAHLARHVPKEKITDAVQLTTKWIWPFPDKKMQQLRVWGHTDYAEYKTSRPDTDNLIKLLKDCMTRVGFWSDDAIVASEVTEKFYGMKPGVYVKVEVIDQWTP